MTPFGSKVDFTLAISAGGKSTRMGTNKALVDVGGRTVIERMLTNTAHLGQRDTILIANAPDEYAFLGLPMTADVYPDSGSLGGIFTALTVSQTPHTLVLACDMPFVSAELLRLMLAQVNDEVDVVVPRVDGFPQALHAIYSAACKAPIEARIKQGNLRIVPMIKEMRARYLDEPDYAPIDPDGTALMNVNTPEELEHARQIAAQKD
jgi:molybdopterin-guanine dinucleotide biosynthesis protein A